MPREHTDQTKPGVSQSGPAVRGTHITEGVEGLALRTPTLPPATHTNSYALGTREVLLVEPATPYAEEQRAFVEWARGLESQGRSLRGLFVTHHHIDHVGGAELLSRELGLPLLLHPKTLERLPELATSQLELLSPGQCIRLEGPTPQVWQVLHTPGHAHGHLCLHEETLRALVVGDMVASEGTILIEPGDGHMGTYLVELERLARLSAELALPAHGAPILQPTELFQAYIRHRGMREAKVLDSVEQRPNSDLDALVALAYADTPPQIWGLAKLSLAAHLIKLVEEGRVQRDGERYAPVAQG